MFALSTYRTSYPFLLAGTIHFPPSIIRLNSDGSHCKTGDRSCITSHHDCGAVDRLHRAAKRASNASPARQPSTRAGFRAAHHTRQTLENIQHAEISPSLRPTVRACNSPPLACNIRPQEYHIHAPARPAIPFSSPCSPPSHSRAWKHVQFSAHPTENACHAPASTVMIVADTGVRPFRLGCGSLPRAPRAPHIERDGAPPAAGNGTETFHSPPAAHSPQAGSASSHGPEPAQLPGRRRAGTWQRQPATHRERGRAWRAADTPISRPGAAGSERRDSACACTAPFPATRPNAHITQAPGRRPLPPGTPLRQSRLASPALFFWR